MKFWKTTRRELKRSLTILFLPHNTSKPLRISLTVSFLVFLIFAWSGLTIWAGYLSSRHIDYWRIRAENELIKLKLIFFAQQVRKSQEMLDEVRDTDAQIRSLLKLKSKKAIIEYEGKGGPNREEMKDLTRRLEGRIHELSMQDINRQIKGLIQESKKRLQSYNEVIDYVEQQRSIERATPKGWPCIGHITSYFGFRVHPILKHNEFHYGIDIANVGNTPVYATAYGTVKFGDWQVGFGRVIIIEHGHGYRTYYGHLKKILVKPGDKIRRRQLIGLMGNTGTSTGDHVHYEIQYYKKSVNPIRYMRKRTFDVARSLAPKR